MAGFALALPEGLSYCIPTSDQFYLRIIASTKSLDSVFRFQPEHRIILNNIIIIYVDQVNACLETRYNANMHPAIFLDRDGVIVENRANYIRNWADVAFYPAALTALARIRSSLYKIIIITNQSVVGRNIISKQAANAINQQIIETITAAGGRIEGIYMCPHAPQDECECRKPKPGLFLQAAKDLDIDLQSSVMIGDAWSDLLAGQNAGIRRLCLVLTGRGAEQAAQLPPSELKAYTQFADLSAALMVLVPPTHPDLPHSPP